MIKNNIGGCNGFPQTRVKRGADCQHEAKTIEGRIIKRNSRGTSFRQRCGNKRGKSLFSISVNYLGFSFTSNDSDFKNNSLVHIGGL